MNARGSIVSPVPHVDAAAPSEPNERAQGERTAAALAAKTGIPYFDTRLLEEVPEINPLLPLELLRNYQVALLHFHEHGAELGLTEHTDRARLPELQHEVANFQLTFKTISHDGFSHILNTMYYRSFQAARDGDFTAFGAKLAASAPKEAFGLIAQLAFWLGASDIHIEPKSENARIRFRLDGTLHPITTVATQSYKIFLSDLQTRAEIKWGSDEPQGGRISYTLMNNATEMQPVNMRIETIPTFHGEEIVVRIFNAETRDLELNKLGFSSEQIKRLSTVISHQSGMVLTVGPTGSGKTSTLYSVINQLNNPEIKIVTLEDPVEYELPGITQIPVHTDDTELFAEKLRAVMREDPNVVMIGEIRDVDTAKTALQAALTGHLVLSTFHAGNAAAAISRMLDMLNRNPLFPSAVRLIVAQRLVRRICPYCTVGYSPTTDQAKWIEGVIKNVPEDRRHSLTGTHALKIGSGCAKCHGLGYRGRVVIAEMMPITPDVEQLMTAATAPTAQELQARAVANGMATMMEDGLHKVFDGITTIEELMRVSEA